MPETGTAGLQEKSIRLQYSLKRNNMDQKMRKSLYDFSCGIRGKTCISKLFNFN